MTGNVSKEYKCIVNINELFAAQLPRMEEIS
jgi:hypothetical protein